MTAEQASAGEAANSKLRELMAHIKSFMCTDLQIGDAALLYKVMHQKSTLRWRGLAKILDSDGTGGIRKF